ncbi:MAG: hypothetical protein LRZ88_08745 [Candidatus Cloacimonetes bacterium]|nr:hypothetical protein [Candidatus Cloacimonadota bacterium]
MEQSKLEGTISRIASDIKDGRSFYYFSLIEKPGLIFVATSNLSSFLPLSRPGDRVIVSYLNTYEREININEYKNLGLEE